MPIDVLVFGDLALRADLIEAVQRTPEGTRLVLTTGRTYDVGEEFDLVVRVMKSMKPPASPSPASVGWSQRHSA